MSSLLLYTILVLFYGSGDLTDIKPQLTSSWRNRPVCPHSESVRDIAGCDVQSKTNRTIRRTTNGANYERRSSAPTIGDFAFRNGSVAMTTTTKTTPGVEDVGSVRETGLKVPEKSSISSSHATASSSSTRMRWTGVDTTHPSSEVATVKPLYIGALFELSGSGSSRGSGLSDLESAQLAIRHINERQFVPGYRLELIYNDTKVSIGAMCNCNHR